MHDPKVKIFDVRGKWNGDQSEALENYKSAHITGAAYLDWTHHFLEQDKDIHLASVAEEKQANESFKELGIDSDDLVVLYDDYHHMLAGRVWWAMRYCGFHQVKILNGGWSNWRNDPTNSVSAEIPVLDEGSFHSHRRTELSVSLSELITIKSSINLIDGRGTKGHNGQKDNPRSGHIPGAINIPYSQVLDADTGLFKSKSELQTLFEAKLPGFTYSKTVSSCGSGYAGTVILIALKILGREAALFDGSFSVWQLDNNNPVQQS